MAADQPHVLGVRLVEDRVVEDQDAVGLADQRPDLVPEGFGVGFEPVQQAGEGVVGGGVGRWGCTRAASVAVHDLGRRQQELDVVLRRTPRRVHDP